MSPTGWSEYRKARWAKDGPETSLPIGDEWFGPLVSLPRVVVEGHRGGFPKPFPSTSWLRVVRSMMKTDLKKVLVKYAREVRCPQCRAGRGAPCGGDVGRRGGVHAGRLQKVEMILEREQRGGPPPREDREEYRRKIRSVPCPLCGAGVDEKCKSRRAGGRLSVHLERSQAYGRQQGPW